MSNTQLLASGPVKMNERCVSVIDGKRVPNALQVLCPTAGHKLWYVELLSPIVYEPSRPHCHFPLVQTTCRPSKANQLIVSFEISVFTGIIEQLGVIQKIEELKGGFLLAVETGWGAGDAGLGASIAINGCCLTVVKTVDRIQSFEAGKETLSRTNLGELKLGSKVNLERGMKADARFDGHIVTGHVDAIGRLVERNNDHDWSEFWFEVPSALTRQMASKGSVTVNGVSLTLVHVTDTRFSIALIPHTLVVTNLGAMRIGDSANIETDVLAKYIERQLQFFRAAN